MSVTAQASMDCDVAIVGCGPVGALAANLLGRAGLRTVVLEREAALHPLPRAVHLDHEMMRLFQAAGVIDRVAPQMRDTDGHLHVGADHGAIRYMGTVGRPRPFGWSNDYFFYQPELEAFLREGFAGLSNVELRAGVALESLGQDESGVTLGVRGLDGAGDMLRARWVIACDGARSTVRKLLDVTLDDLGFEEPWLVVDAEVDGPVTFPPLTGVPPEADLQRLSVMMCDPSRPATIVPWPRQPPALGVHAAARRGRCRHDDARGGVAARRTVARGRAAPARARRDLPLPRPDRRALEGSGACSSPAMPRTRRRRSSARACATACATSRTSPGSCRSSPQARRPSALLETYQPERDPHVRAVISAAVAAGRYICMLDPAAAAARDAAMRDQAKRAAPGTAGDLIPAIGTGIVATGTEGAGERFIQPRVGEQPLDAVTGSGWRLFVADAASAERARALCRSRVPGLAVATIELGTLDDADELRGWLEARQARAVLVRPDFYVFGTCAGDPEELVDGLALALGCPQRQERAA